MGRRCTVKEQLDPGLSSATGTSHVNCRTCLVELHKFAGGRVSTEKGPFYPGRYQTYERIFTVNADVLWDEVVRVCIYFLDS
jgi:hypothetical protein